MQKLGHFGFPKLRKTSKKPVLMKIGHESRPARPTTSDAASAAA